MTAKVYCVDWRRRLGMNKAWHDISFAELITERKERFEPDSLELAGLTGIKKIDFAEGKIHLGEYIPTKTQQIIVEPGDFVFSGLNIEKGAANFNETGKRLVVSANYSTCKFNDRKVNSTFFKYYIRTQIFQNLLKDNLKKDYGFTRPKHLLGISFPVPKNKADQKRIVAKYEKNKNICEKLVTEIAHQKSILADIKHAILREAIQGKLTADWRTENPNVEPAGELIRRIQAEKARLIAEKKIRKEKPLPEITADEIPFEIPVNWEWCQSTAPSYILSDRNKKIPTSQIMGTGKHPVVDQGKPLVRGYTNDGKCLIKLDGPIVLFGDHTQRTKYIDFDFVVGADGVKLLRPILVNAKYYHLALSSVRFESKMYARHFKFLKASIIPIPPLAEQIAIVERFEKLMIIYQKLATEIERSHTYAMNFLQTALNEFFTPSTS